MRISPIVISHFGHGDRSEIELISTATSRRSSPNTSHPIPIHPTSSATFQRPNCNAAA